MTITFAGRVESRMTVPTGGVAVSATVANGAVAQTATTPAANYYLTSAGGVSSLITAFQTALNAATNGYARTTGTTASMLGYGTWTTGAYYACQESSGNLASTYGSPATLTAASTPSYGNTGPGNGGDLAVGFDSASDAFNGGAGDFDVGANDLIVALVGKWASLPAAYGAVASKVAAALASGWVVFTNDTASTYGLFTQVNAGAGFQATVGSAGYCAGEWHVAIGVVDRSTGKMRFGTKGLTSGTATISTETTVAGNFTTAASFSLGSSAWVAAPTNYQLAGIYLVTGAGVATGLSANLSTALTNFYNAIRASWAVSLSTTNGLVSIGWTGYITPTWSLSWTSTDLRDVLGFTANISGVTTTQTGTQQARGLWLPDCPPNIEGDPKRAPLVSDARTSMSPTGQTITLVGNTHRRHRSLVWSHVPIAQVWDAEATYENGSWEEFFSETQLGLGSSWFTPGSPVQIYWSNAGTDALLGSDATIAGWSIIGLNSIEPQKSDPNWTGLWRIEIPTLVAVGS